MLCMQKHVFFTAFVRHFQLFYLIACFDSVVLDFSGSENRSTHVVQKTGKNGPMIERQSKLVPEFYR